MSETLHSAALARLAGISADTLRYYERNRLLPAAPRSHAGYRVFPREALRRVKAIQRSLSFGFSIKELSAIFQERDCGGRPCQRVRALGDEKLELLCGSIRELQSKRKELKRILGSWDKLLQATCKNERAGLLETLSGERK